MEFLQLALQEQEANSKDRIPVLPNVQMQSPVPVSCSSCVLGRAWWAPESLELWGKSALQESILAVCEGFIFHSGCAQTAAAQVPGGSCSAEYSYSAECSYTGQVLLPESHFLPSPIALITARLKLWTGFFN